MCGLPPKGHCRESSKGLQDDCFCTVFCQSVIYLKGNYGSFVEHCHSYNTYTRGKDNLVSNFYYARTLKMFLSVSIKLFNSSPQCIKTCPDL